MERKIETIAVQGEYNPKNTEPRVLPLYQGTTYKYDTCAELARVFDLEQGTHMYTRLSNPTTDMLEKKIAAMEGGAAAIATATGMAAVMFSILNICKSGDSILSASTIYGGSFTLFTTTFKDLGIEVIFFDPKLSAEDIISMAKPNTKAVYGETLGNPALNVLDLEKISGVSKALGVPFIVDNTFPTPILCRPIEFGADIVLHSTTKYIDGHASAMGGIIIDSGKFNWENGKFPGMTEPDESYHGVRYVKDFGEMAYITKIRVGLMRNIGATPSPFNSYITHMNSETLHLRMERHSENALKLAEYLKSNPKCAWVNYPGLPEDENYELAQKYLKKGASGVLSFGVSGGKAAAESLCDNLRLAKIVTHVADVRTCVLQPASTTHRQLSDEGLKACGVSADMIRVSVGIENINDIIADFEQAFQKC